MLYLLPSTGKYPNGQSERIDLEEKYIWFFEVFWFWNIQNVYQKLELNQASFDFWCCHRYNRDSINITIGCILNFTEITAF